MSVAVLGSLLVADEPLWFFGVLVAMANVGLTIALAWYARELRRAWVLSAVDTRAAYRAFYRSVS
jgi:hypothetical protein